MINNKNIIKERSRSIPIKGLTIKKNETTISEYSLKQNFFDPSKSSPPNEFMLKLKNRMEKLTSVIQFEINDDNLEIE